MSGHSFRLPPLDVLPLRMNLLHDALIRQTRPLRCHLQHIHGSHIPDEATPSRNNNWRLPEHHPNHYNCSLRLWDATFLLPV